MNINRRTTDFLQSLQKLHRIPSLNRPLRIVLISLCVFISTIDAKLKNAGILPYYYDAYGSAYFLIGQEKNGTWADFGGGSEKKDKNQKYVAAREFSEETRLVFGKYAAGLQDLQRAVKTKDIPYYLKKSIDYIHPRITASVPHPAGYYIMYLAQVDYISEKDFNHAAKIPHYEKKRYKWVPVEEFMRSMKEPKNKARISYKGKLIRKQFYETFSTNYSEIMKTIYSKNT